MLKALGVGAIKMLGVLLVAAFMLYGLYSLSDGSTTTDRYNQALTWAKDLLGLGASLAGFLGISAAASHQGIDATQRAAFAAGGVGGLLAGATFLEIGGWPVPAALAAMAAGGSLILAKKL